MEDAPHDVCVRSRVFSIVSLHVVVVVTGVRNPWHETRIGGVISKPSFVAGAREHNQLLLMSVFSCTLDGKPTSRASDHLDKSL